jgi:hypothetical protein
MNPDDQWPARDPELSRLIQDAVSDVESADRLEELRGRTAPAPRRRWLFAVGGAVVAAAAVVTAVAVIGADPAPTPDPGLADSPTSAVESPSGSPPTASTSSRAVAGYYLGDTPSGVRLYREFRSLPAEPLPGALELLATQPVDPDYRTPWQPGQLLDASFDGAGADAMVTVIVDPSVRARPAGMSGEEAQAAVQQVVYTLQAAVQARAPVRFGTADGSIDQVLGVPTAEPVANAAVLRTLSLVNLTTPEEGAAVSGTLDVAGVANSSEANVPWTLRRGDDVVDQGSFTAEGWMGQRLFPFSGEVDVSSLDPGSYTLIVETDDPSGGTEGPGAFSDTRTIVLE